MIPNNSVVSEVTSTFMGEQVEMGFDPAALRSLMGILSEIYSDPEMAVIREYATNALDSHLEAGQTRPVEITTPNDWNRNLRIRDYGIGMNAEDIRNTYSLYGASTKRESNVASGMLGIGSKSAFAYSNAFTVTGVKDGIKTLVSVSRDDEGRGTMTIVSQTETEDGNGVTIDIPTQNSYSAKRKVIEFAAFLPEGVLLVDGEDLSERGKWAVVAENIKDEDGNVIINTIWSTPKYGSSKVLMGSVAYEPVTELANREVSNTLSVIADVAMGAVVFQPSREKLMDVGLTRRTEAAIKEAYHTHLSKSIIKDIKDSATPHEALSKYHKQSRTLRNLGVSKVEYKGKEIPGPTAIASKSDTLIARSVYPNRSTNVYDSVSYANWETFSNTKMFVVNAPDKALNHIFRKKLEQYCDNNNITVFSEATKTNNGGWYNGNYYAHALVFPKDRKESDDFIKSYWMQGIETVEYADIAAEVLPKRPRNSGSGGGVKTSGKHFVYDKNGMDRLTDIDDDAKIRYFVKSEMRDDWGLGGVEREQNYMGTLSTALAEDDIFLVHVYANRLEKFKRDHPNAKPLTKPDATAILDAYFQNNVSDDDFKRWVALGVGHYDWQLRQNLNTVQSAKPYIPSEDKDVTAFVKTLSEDSKPEDASVPNTYKSILPASYAARMDKAIKEMRPKVTDIISRYPAMNLVNHSFNNKQSVLNEYFQLDFDRFRKEQNDSV